jgi:PAS domain S-box-containing protein
MDLLYIGIILLLIAFLVTFVVSTFIFVSRLTARLNDKQRRLINEIEERKQVEVRLQKSEALYRLLIQHLPRSAILMFDHDLRHTLMEGPYLEQLGYRKERFKGRTLYEAVPPESVPRLLPHYERALKGEESDIEGKVNGFDFHASYMPIIEQDGRIIGGLILVQDVTKEKESSVKAVELAIEREKTRMMGDFVRDISHDFRTPLSIMTTNLYLIKRDPDAERRELRASTIQNQITRLSKILEQMVVMSNLEMGVGFVFKSVDLSVSLNTLADRFRSEAATKGIALVSHIDAELPLVSADLNQLHRAVENVLENALRYTKAGDCIEITAENVADTLTIHIRDTGEGISPEALPLIWDRFYRTDEARGQNSGGAGLGLAMVKKIIEKHGGKVNVTSTLGAGSTFSLSIPQLLHGMGKKRTTTQQVSMPASEKELPIKTTATLPSV